MNLNFKKLRRARRQVKATKNLASKKSTLWVSPRPVHNPDETNHERVVRQRAERAKINRG